MAEYINWSEILHNLVRLIGALIISLPIAWHRERQTRSVGMRTFPLVAIGACAFILTGKEVVPVESDALARVFHGVITGMGFIGGGAILKKGDYVRGTANAASLWCTGAIGTAVAFDRYEIAIVLSLTILVIFIVKPAISQDDVDDDC